MSDPAVNCTLEVSCTVGSLDNALDALEEGADINCRSGAPLFNAIFNRNVEIIRMLIEKGADLSLFLPPAKLKPLGDDIDQIVEALMACAPPDPDAIEVDAMEELDEEIRAKGLEAPVKSGDWDGLVRYSEKLEKIGATKALACVVELIELLNPAREFGDAALFESIKAEKKAIKVIGERYCEEAEDIGNLSQFYVSSQGSTAPEPISTTAVDPNEPEAVVEVPRETEEEPLDTEASEKSDGMSANHELPTPKDSHPGLGICLGPAG